MSSLSLRFQRILSMMLLSLTIAACSGGGGGDTATVTTSNPDGPYTISVITSGLTGSGLQAALVSSSGNETITISANGTQSFALKLPKGDLYSVAISTQPSGQACSVDGSTLGTIGSNVAVAVTCTGLKTVGGSVSGLSGSLVLRLNGSNSMTITQNGGFAFTQEVATGDYYAVTVGTQPANQLCLVGNSYGVVGSTAITNVAVTCSAPPAAGYKVGGSISGFSGLVALKLNSSEVLPLTYNGSFSFSTPLPAGTPFDVVVDYVKPGYECKVANGAGIMASSDYPFVDIDCVVGGTVIYPKVDPDGANLSTSDTMVVTLNGIEDKSLTGWNFDPAAFKTALQPGDTYEITIKTQPLGKNCVLFDSVGVIQAGVTPVATMGCAPEGSALYTIGGSVTGLNGSGLVLELDGRDTLAIDAGTTSYVFPDGQVANIYHHVSVKTHPAGQICSIQNGTVWLSGNASNTNVVCSTGPHSISGYVSGLSSTGLVLQLNGAETLQVPAQGGPFTFSTLLSDGMSYAVSIQTQPANQLCTLKYASGAALTKSISNVMVDCVPRDYAVGVNVQGYGGTTPLLLLLNGDEMLSVTSNTLLWGSAPKLFTTRLKQGDSYNVQIAAQPEARVCTIANPSGVVNGADVTNIGVVCATDTSTAGNYTVGVTTAGLLGSGTVLQLNGGNDITIPVNGYTTFATGLASGATYTVTVKSQPLSPLQVCKVINGSGTIGTTNITNVSIQCGNALQSLYPAAGSKWLDYVKNDGVSKLTASGTACDAAVDGSISGGCMHGGELMAVTLPGLASCTGIVADDNLHAFNWSCDASASGVRVVSTGLRTGVGLRDLIDFTESAFKPNFVTISGAINDATQPAIWWTNPVRINNFGDPFYTQGEINLVTGWVPFTYSMIGRTAVLVQPGAAITGSVSASSHSFLWFEGDISGAPGIALNWTTTNYSVLNNVQAVGNGGTGIALSGSNLSLRNVNASGNSGDGLSIFASNSSLADIVANDNVNGTGIRISTGGNLTLSNATANGNGAYNDGIRVIGNTSLPANHVFSNLTANGNGYDGIHLEDIGAGSFTDLKVHGNGDQGLEVDTTTHTSFTNVIATGNGGSGMRLFRWDNGKGESLISMNNGLKGVTGNDHGVRVEQSKKCFVADVTSGNNRGNGYTIDHDQEVVSSNVTAVNNGGVGVAFIGGDIVNFNNHRNVLNGATAANNVSHGVETTRMHHLHLSSVVSVNNGGNGFYDDTFVYNRTFVNLVSANNAGYGFRTSASYDHYSGLLHVGSNALGDCLVEYLPTLPGLTQVKGGNQCAVGGTSDAVIVAGVNASSSLVGKVVSDDAVSTDDASGSAQYTNITDWTQFEHLYRSWGKDGVAFASTTNQGACVSGSACRIWDWSAANGDIGNGGAAAVHDVVLLPAAADLLVMTWDTTAATDQAYCDINYPGSVWEVDTCKTSYLRHARELRGYGGNGNDLCELGETCLYMPNIGSHQGQGILTTVGTIGTGADTITLMKYETTGL